MKNTVKFLCVTILCALLSVNFSEYVFSDNTKYYLDDRSVFECEGFAEWIRGNIDGAQDGKLSEWECLRVSEINISGEEKIKSLKGIEVFENLYSVDASFSGIETFDASHLFKLAFLNIGYTDVEKLDLLSNPRIYDLNVDYTKIKELDLSNCSELYSLSLEGADIKTLDLTQNTELFYLSARESALLEIRAKNNSKLTVADLAYTDVENLDLSGCGALVHLDISSSALASLEIEGCTLLEYIDLSKTEIGDIDVSEFSELAHLDLSYTRTESIDTHENKKLFYLNVSNTQTETLDLSGNPMLNTIIAGNTKIKELDLTGCKEIRFFFFPAGDADGKCGVNDTLSDEYTHVEVSLHDENKCEKEALAKTEKETQKEAEEDLYTSEKLPRKSGEKNILCVLHKNMSAYEKYFFRKLSQNLLQNE